jgi:hypothetical protein
LIVIGADTELASAAVPV